MSDKITGRHLSHRAVLYVRQSTAHQVQHNEESRRLQYKMGDRLRDLGWREVEVIDEDLGRSAGGSVERTGFQRLVTGVSLGEVGAVAARELSRFARNSRDWQKLIEVCRYVDTLLIDQDGVYDTRQSNDRLLLGLKGSLNEYELDLLRLRALEARTQKARRGEFLAKIAVGYRKSEDGRLEVTPDRRVQQVVRLAFEKTLELGSARQCLLWLRERGIEVPTNRNHRGQVRWKVASYSWVHQVLVNPVYAGAYAYGRSAVETVMQEGEPRRRTRCRPREQWTVLIRDHHEAYIEWETFERIRQLMANNAQTRWASLPGAAKQGEALLAGLLRCRRCGHKLTVRSSGAARNVVRYVCKRDNMRTGDATCIGFSGVDVDVRIAEAVLEVVRPAAIEAARQAESERSRERDEASEALRLQLEATRFEADRAFRQYDEVDPENRVVASELERRWNLALERVHNIEARVRELDERRRDDGGPLGTHELSALAADLPAVWNAPSTDARLKKRIVRTLLEEVVADVDDASSTIVLVVHWKGGVHSELRIAKRRRGVTRTTTASDAVEAIRALALVCADAQIAHWLNKAGLKTARGLPWARDLVASVRNAHEIGVFEPERCTADGWLTMKGAAELVGLAELTVKRAVARGVVSARRPLPAGPWILQRDELLRADVRDRLTKKGGPRPDAPAVPRSIQLTLGIPST